MYMLQLFDVDDAIQPIDARLLRDGTISLGRDTACDWPIADPDRALSRAHCEVATAGNGLIVRALGTNGVFDAVTEERLPDGVDVPLAPPCALRLGRFRLAVSHARLDDGPRDVEMTMVLTPPLGTSVAVPTDWSDAVLLADSDSDSLLEAFCRGAGLDASQLSGEEPVEIMERAGALYRQMVLGIGDLMAERDRARGRFDLARTTIGGAGNNPFKWAPTQRLAIDLLLSGKTGFLSGPAALVTSFADIKRHLVASFAGFRAAMRGAVDTFAPDAIDAAAARAPLLKSRAAMQMAEVAARYDDLAAQLDGGSAGSLDRAFVAAYAEAERGADGA